MNQLLAVLAAVKSHAVRSLLSIVGYMPLATLGRETLIEGFIPNSTKFLVVKCMDAGYSRMPGQTTNPDVVESCSIKQSMLDKSSARTPALTTLKKT